MKVTGQLLGLNGEDPRDLTQRARLGIKCLYLLSHLACLRSASFILQSRKTRCLDSHLTTESHDHHSTLPSLVSRLAGRRI